MSIEEGKFCVLRGMLSGSRTLNLDPLVYACVQVTYSVVGPGFIPPNYMLPQHIIFLWIMESLMLSIIGIWKRLINFKFDSEWLTKGSAQS